MKIDKGSYVELHYILHVDSVEGEVVEKTTEGEPLRFTYGEDAMLPKFEAAVLGLSAGEKFKVAIPCAEAYGDEDEGLYMEFPKSEFIGDDGEWDDELFAEGEIVPMQTPDGQTVQGIVSEVKLNSIIIDFNHPLAGENLYFEGEVVAVS
ncbi:MAG: FKBP-type peptidyl-prolyl cis-trans isomerase [Crocinitomicaceae bacterium]|nr:FKBP-type peptidyl-prolyl cis-trans isomerase [Crocinitomicaceae bacterium]